MSKKKERKNFKIFYFSNHALEFFRGKRKEKESNKFFPLKFLFLKTYSRVFYEEKGRKSIFSQIIKFLFLKSFPRIFWREEKRKSESNKFFWEYSFKIWDNLRKFSYYFLI